MTKNIMMIKKIIILALLVALNISFIVAQEESANYDIKNLEINDELSNFGTFYYRDSLIMYSSPQRKVTSVKNIWKPNQQAYLNFFVGNMSEDGEILNSKEVKGKANTRYHESSAVFTKDLQTVYFTRDNYKNKKLFSDKNGRTRLAMYKADVLENGEWSNITEFKYNNTEFSIGHPALSIDEKTLYFISNMPGGLGKTDIYKVSILDDGDFGKIENLGNKINTNGKEMFPYISKENILYFSSDGWQGKGMLDVYAIDLNAKKQNEQPKNLGAPINSYLDDFAFIKNEETQTGYFSSNRETGKGDDDIYFFKQKKPLDIPCNQIATGIVKDKNTGRRIPNALVVLYDENGKELDFQVVKEDARFSFEIDCKSKYKVTGSKETYTEDSETFISNTKLELGLNLDMSIEKIPPPPTPIVSTPVYTSPSEPTFDKCQNGLNNINTIYFDLNKYYIRPDAAAELNRVILIMQQCPSITIEAGSHTDSRASNTYNLSLSQKRAQSTVDYITHTGIAKNRIYAVGYGEERLLNRCSDNVQCSEPEHQVNRRTKFTIVKF